MNDKEIELNRYNNSSSNKLNEKLIEEKLSIIGSLNYPKYLQAPFKKYENLINDFSLKNKNIHQLDLCCGDGIHSFNAAFNGANVIAVDYAEKSIEIAKLRASKIGVPIDFRVCDVDNLDFEDEQFDIVTCVGSLSYVDQDKFILEIRRILKPEGIFICLDSFNHNILYRLNRNIHYLKGKRSKSTLKKMPNEELISKIRPMFKDFKIFHFGIFSFLAPILAIFFDENKTAIIIDNFDTYFSFLKKYSFKIVFYAIK